MSPLSRSILAAAIAGALAHPASAADATSIAAPLRVILVGDSTMTAKAGYGGAFCERFVPQVSCTVLARSGRGSGSYRAEKHWQEVQRLLKDGAQQTPTYVLVQFGHNDVSGGPQHRSNLATEFPANMARYAQEIRALGGTPVLVTPLVRRTFEGGAVKDDLAPWAEATRGAAKQTSTALLDLHRLSTDAVQPMGQAAADTLGPTRRPAQPVAGEPPLTPEQIEASKFDRTHLNAKGAVLFSGIVAADLARLFPAIKPFLKP